MALEKWRDGMEASHTTTAALTGLSGSCGLSGPLVEASMNVVFFILTYFIKAF